MRKLMALFALMATVLALHPSMYGQNFRLVSPEASGVTFENRIEESDSFNVIRDFYAYNGGGVGVGDLDGDGLLDLVFTSTQHAPGVYRNRGGLRFENVSQQIGLPSSITGMSSGVLVADLTGDGWVDIVISRRYEPALLFINDGTGHFREETQDIGFVRGILNTQFYPIDFDRDGDLDLFVLTNGEPRRKGYLNPGQHDVLLENLGNGHWLDVTTRTGILDSSYGLSAAIADVDGNGWPDIFVANDFEGRDLLWMNNGDGTFTDKAEASLQNMSWASMGSDIADLNDDGRLDIMSVDMFPEEHERRMSQIGMMSIYGPFFDSTQRMHNTFHLNQGAGHFVNANYLAGVAATDWSWSVLAQDYDNDGLTDIFITNGIKRDIGDQDWSYNLNVRSEKLPPSIYLEMPRSRPPLYLFRGSSDYPLRNVAAEQGMGQLSIANGAAYADLDNDGDLDIVVNNTDTVAFLYRNMTVESGEPDHHWLRIQLRGAKPNTTGIGAHVELWANGRRFVREHNVARGYLSTVDPVLHVGLGDVQRIDSIHVRWSNGTLSRFGSYDVDQVLSLKQESQELWVMPAPLPVLMTPLPFSVLPSGHRENRYDDFKRERLIPYRLSQFGPGIAHGDVNGDNLDDVVLTGAKYSFTRLWLQQSDGSFAEHAGSGLSDIDEAEDVDVALFDVDNDGDLDCYVVTGGNEFEPDDHELADRFYINDGKGLFKRADSVVPRFLTSGTCVRPADIDGDGDLDLFVGGRVVPGRFPTAEPSRLFRNDHGRFVDVTEAYANALLTSGMITDGVWIDTDGDGDLDLVIIGEWMSPKLFVNNKGRLTDGTANSGFAGTHGLWTSIAAADIDRDGDMDLVAGNIGLNTQYVPSFTKPIYMTVGDFDENGSIDPIISYVESEQTQRERPTRGRMSMVQHMPVLTRTFNTYRSYSTAYLQDIIPQAAIDTAQRYMLNEFASCVFRNQGGAFAFEKLPSLAQVAPVHGILPIDLDADGHLDLVLSQNNRGPDGDVVSLDGGIGCVLLGDGKGGFAAVAAESSGYAVPQTARRLARITTADGSTLIVVAVNEGPVQTFKLLHDQPGR